MDGGEDSSLAREVAAAIAWWCEAGVDLCFDDEPARWISPAQPTAIEAQRLRAELREAVPIRADHGSLSGLARGTPGGASPGLGLAAAGDSHRQDTVNLSTFPANMELFDAWWLAEPSLDDGRSGGRVGPRGNRKASLMVLVPEPERDDGDRLLAGPQGRMLAAILSSLGVHEDAVYIASALPRHMPMPDWPDLAVRGFGMMLARHVTLAAPKSLIVFGEGILSLLYNSLTHKDHDCSVFGHGSMEVPLFRARSLDALLARPAWKAELWNRMLAWMPQQTSWTNDKGAED